MKIRYNDKVYEVLIDDKEDEDYLIECHNGWCADESIAIHYGKKYEYIIGKQVLWIDYEDAEIVKEVNLSEIYF